MTLKVSRSLYCFTTSIFHGVENCFPRLWGMGISAAIFNNPAVDLFIMNCNVHVTMGSWKGRGNQYIQLVKVLCYKLLTNDKQLPTFPLKVRPGTKLRSHRCYHSPP